MFTVAIMPIEIKAKYITSSNVFFTGFRNLTIERAPTRPSDNAIFDLIEFVIAQVIIGNKIKVKVWW